MYWNKNTVFVPVFSIFERAPPPATNIKQLLIWTNTLSITPEKL